VADTDCPAVTGPEAGLTGSEKSFEPTDAAGTVSLSKSGVYALGPAKEMVLVPAARLRSTVMFPAH
jgi:hypothetical protein